MTWSPMNFHVTIAITVQVALHGVASSPAVWPTTPSRRRISGKIPTLSEASASHIRLAAALEITYGRKNAVR